MAILNHRIGISIVTIICVFLSLAAPAFAKVVTFEKEYTYQASEIDSKVTSRAIAVEQVKRLVLEELGTYLMAETEVKDFRLTKDKVVMLTAGIVQTEILNEKWDGERYYLKARIKADPDEVATSVDRLRKDTQKSKELEDTKKRADEAFELIEKLKKELETVKSDTNKQKEYAKAADTLSAMDWFDKGIRYSDAKEYDKAIEAYTKVIALENPSIEPGLRGNIHALSYHNRGNAYRNKNMYDMAIEDYDKSIQLDPDYANAYGNRGAAYADKGERDRAIEDFNKAIQLDPNLAYVYNNRGFAYRNKDMYDRAIEDYNKAIQLDPNLAHAYGNRAVAYNKKGQHDRAIEDSNKMIALEPNNAIPYGIRATAYWKTGDRNRAIADWQKACDMGTEWGCKNLEWGLKNR